MPRPFTTILTSTTESNHIGLVKDHMMTLGKIFNKEDLARQKVSELDEQVKQVQAITANRPERALVVLHNNGAFSNFGIQSRYGFIFNAFGVKACKWCGGYKSTWATYFE